MYQIGVRDCTSMHENGNIACSSMVMHTYVLEHAKAILGVCFGSEHMLEHAKHPFEVRAKRFIQKFYEKISKKYTIFGKNLLEFSAGCNQDRKLL